MTGLLASVAALAEMETVHEAGADIVDLKDPRAGALGAWPLDQLKEAVRRWRLWPAPRPALSATIGDLPLEPGTVIPAVEALAGSSVPLIKIGLFPSPAQAECIRALTATARRARLVAVFLADLEPDLDLLPEVARAGFAGAMIDTAVKDGRALPDCLPLGTLAAFVRDASRLGLMTGLAGSLRIEHIRQLAALGPSYLGFRGALCANGRTGTIDLEAVRRIRAALERASAERHDQDLALAAGAEVADQPPRA